MIYNLNENVELEESNPIDELREAAITVLEYCEYLKESRRIDKEIDKELDHNGPHYSVAAMARQTQREFENEIRNREDDRRNLNARIEKQIARKEFMRNHWDQGNNKYRSFGGVLADINSKGPNKLEQKGKNKPNDKSNFRGKDLKATKESVAMIYNFLDSIDE